MDDYDEVQRLVNEGYRIRMTANRDELAGPVLSWTVEVIAPVKVGWYGAATAPTLGEAARQAEAAARAAL